VSAVPLALLALAIGLGLPWNRRLGGEILAGLALLAFGLTHFFPAPFVALGPVSFLADGPALIALAAGTLAARNQPKQLLFFVALATLTADLRLFLLALVGLVATERAVAKQSEPATGPASAAERRGNLPDSLPFSAAGPGLPAGGRRLVLTALPLVALAAILATPTGFALDVPGSTRGVVQLRAFGALGLLAPAVLLLPPAARATGLALWLFAFTRFGLPLWPEAGPTVAPYLTWVAGGLALVGAGLSWWRPGFAALVLLGTGLLGAVTATSPGLSGAVLLAAALVLLPTLAAAPLALAGAALALHASWWAVPAFPGPTLVAAGALAVAAIPLIRKAISHMGAGRVPVALAASLALPPLTGLPLPGAEATAMRSARRSLAADDVWGWRRLSRAQMLAAPQDAGAP
jgi:hypothetical protein